MKKPAPFVPEKGNRTSDSKSRQHGAKGSSKKPESKMIVPVRMSDHSKKAPPVLGV